MSDAAAGGLTSAPVVAFGVVGLLAGRVARRFGLAATFVAAVSALAVGLVARVLIPRPMAVLVATGVAVAGAALGNVLLPVAVKRWFPDRLGWATALYSMALVLGSAAAAAATCPDRAGRRRLAGGHGSMGRASPHRAGRVAAGRRSTDGRAGRPIDDREHGGVGAPQSEGVGTRGLLRHRASPPTRPWDGCRRSTPTPA